MKKKMKAALCTAPEKIEMTEVDVPVPKEGEVLVQVKATGLCGSDVDGYLGKHPMIGYPIIMGHECSGVVAALGPGVTGVAQSDAVVVEPFFTCKKCPACLRGKYNLCKDLLIIGHQIPGSLAEYVLAESMFVHPKPENIGFDEAAIVEPLSGSLHAVKRAGVTIGDFTVVIGAGTMGSFALQHCRNAGAETLIADVEDFKLELAASLGADHTLNVKRENLRDRVQELTGGVGADVVIEACGHPATLAQTTTLVKRGGTIMLIGWSGNKADPFDLTSLTLDELTVLGTLGFAWDFPTALGLAGRGKVDLGAIISHHFPLEKTEEAIKLFHSGKERAWKIIITYD
jgi:L-iditol 2-dehydrogenase